ncbi:MAG: single-stranded DNA-binding protein [Patescibacteria group bacterium]|nr:single-stranded DNA-binding protein [Patescibacteria group bacterium]
MRSVNEVTLIGNLTRDPRVRDTQSNQKVTTFSIATNRHWTTKEGEQKSLTEYHDIVTWSRLAEICGDFLKKGKLVYVKGYLKTRSWESETGEKHYKTEIVAHDVIMLDKRSGEEGADNFTPDDQPAFDEAPSEDIPF